MIDWNIKEILNIQDHYNEIFTQNLDLIYFVKHFEEIYRWIYDDVVILPDLLNDITYYTVNGVNAKDKMIFNIDDDKIISEKLMNKKLKQKQLRHDAINRGLKDYYNFLNNELVNFIEKYPQWKQIFN